MFVDLLKVQQEEKFEVSSMETGAMSGAPCPEKLCRKVIGELNMRDFSVSRCFIKLQISLKS